MFLLLFLTASLADQVAAFVGNDVILFSEVSENVSILSNDPVARQMFSTDEELDEYVVDQLVSNQLLLIEAEAESIVVGDEEVAPLVNQNVENLKSNFPSEANFFTYLDEQGISLEELKEYYQKNLKSRLIVERLISKKFASKIMISPIAVKQFYEENKDSIANLPGRVKLAHILLPVVPGQDELMRGYEKATDVYRLLLSGADFAVIAQEFSEDENSRRKGGMLGKITKGETIEDFEDIVFKLKPGVVSQPFATRLGYHIVEVLNKGSDWVLLRQILIKVGVTRQDTLRTNNLANRLRDQIRSGTDFDSLAKEHSRDPNVDLGEFDTERLTPPFDSVVRGMEEGDVSEPVLTPYGFHLLYVKEKVPQRTLTFEELRDRIMQYLYQQDVQVKYDELVRDLKEKVFVKVFYPPER
ncbi:MAG: peptidylprolyl isomerase [candidate division WOR-3 bacterium]|nr:MAG: peptidylprolyl isomerase [candidate division WOR-3 bacterium]